MKRISIMLFLLTGLAAVTAYACDKCKNYNNTDFKIKSATVTHHTGLGITVWEIKVEGAAGQTTPQPNGKLHGAPVLGYVFPTTLKPAEVGFSATEGIVALALTTHPDFDDSPVWDENNDGKFDNDGLVWHPHWVVLVKDNRVEGGFSVKEYNKGDASVTLPKTAPGMPMYMDSPGFNVVAKGHSIKVIVPDFRISNNFNFKFDAVTAFMKVNTGEGEGHEGGGKPMLGVYKVYSIASGSLSLPYSVNTIQ